MYVPSELGNVCNENRRPNAPGLRIDRVGAAEGFALQCVIATPAVDPDNDKNRQGFMYALDMEKVIKTAYLGNATPATSFVQADHPSYKKAATVCRCWFRSACCMTPRTTPLHSCATCGDALIRFAVLNWARNRMASTWLRKTMAPSTCR